MSDGEIDIGLFEEPEDFRPEQPGLHYESHARLPENVKSGEPSTIKLQLVGKSPLWGHLLWNAGIETAHYLDEHDDLTRGKTVVELGAAAALPSLVASLRAKNVVATDYPDADLLNNIKDNIAFLKESFSPNSLQCIGYIWGNEVTELVQANNGQKYDTMILSDVVFNHTEHEKLLSSCQMLLADGGKVLVFFSPHRAWLLEKDLEFFETAKKFGFKSERVVYKKTGPMFWEDDESREIRSWVHGYVMERTDANDE